MEIIGNTIDDAAGEAFDKAAKILGLPYPGGPLIDQYAKKGDPNAFKFPKPKIPGLNFSFSGLKTSFLYLIRDELKLNPNFIKENTHDLSASIQHIIIQVLLDKLMIASKEMGIKQIAIAGGVSANSELRRRLLAMESSHQWEVFIPDFEYTTDNAAMIAITGYLKYIRNEFTDQRAIPYARSSNK